MFVAIYPAVLLYKIMHMTILVFFTLMFDKRLSLLL
jgi:hypothetical protein